MGAILAGLIYLILFLSGMYTGTNENEWYYSYLMLWLYGTVFAFLLFNTLIMCVGRKGRSALAAFETRLNFKYERPKRILAEGGSMLVPGFEIELDKFTKYTSEDA